MYKSGVWIAVAALIVGRAVAQPVVQQSIQAAELATREHIVIDGRLDDIAWQRAIAYPVTHQFAPAANSIDIPATTYRVMVDAEYLYVGIDCLDSHPGKIWKALGHRDAMTNANADTVTVWLDPSGKRKLAQMFKIAVGGAIRDGTYYEDSGKVDASPDFAFEAVTRVNDRGWSVEFKIPATSLRLNGHGQPTLLVTRFYPRGDNFFFASTDIDERHHCFLCKNPVLEGLSNMKPGRAVTLTPYASALKSSGDFGNALRGRAGADLKWRVTDSAVVDITAWPDFSQVELDTPQLSANATYALFYPEKRPFFLEGLDLFDTPMRAIYTRTITKPEWGARVTNRGTNNDAVLLTARDAGGGLLLLPGPWATDFIEQPIATALFARSRFRVLGANTGLLGAIKDYGRYGRNVIAGGDAVYTTTANRFNAQVLMSSTTALATAGALAEGESQSDTAAYVGWKHDSTKWHLQSSLKRVGDRFRNDSGFMESSGLYDAGVRTWFDVPPLSGTNQSTLFANAQHQHTLDGQTIMNNFTTGFGVDRGSTSLQLFINPVTQQRVDPTRPLHRIASGELFAILSPARWLPSATFDLNFGKRLDSFSDRVGSGYLFSFTPTFAVSERMRVGVLLAQERIAADDQLGVRRTLLRDSVAELNASHFFDANNELRGTYQHHETYRDPLAFTQTVSERYASDLVSVVYTWTPSLGKAFYAGGTWSSKQTPTLTEGEEFFVKVSWAY